MPVPNTIADLSQTAASNYPLGTDTVGPDLDNYLRAGFAFTRQMFDGTANTLTSVSGTDTVTASCPVPFTAYVAGQCFDFLATGANTTNAVTLNVLSLGAKAVMKAGPSGLVQLSPGDLQSGQSVRVRYDGTQFQVISVPAPTASAGMVNKIVNGGFDVWQRGTSFANAVGSIASYGPDRWQIYRAGFVAGYTASQVTTPALIGSRYALRVQRTAGDTNVQAISVSTSFETADVIRWAGKTVTLSLSALGNGAFNGATLTINVFFGTGVDGNSASGFTGSFGAQTTTQVLTSSYARGAGLTFAVPSTATQFGISMSVTPSGTAGASDYFQLAQIQLNEGASALPFEIRGYAIELGLCIPHYQILKNPKFFGYGSAGAPIGYGASFAQMRLTPSVNFLGTPTYSNASGLSIDSVYVNMVNLYANVTSAGGAAWAAGGDISLNASL